MSQTAMLFGSEPGEKTLPMGPMHDFFLAFLKTCHMCLCKMLSNCPENQTCFLCGHVNATKQDTKHGMGIMRRC